jgi:DNA-binding ferritin-like protein (Dps family)
MVKELTRDFVKDFIDEIMTDMTDDTFRMNVKDRINFRGLLLEEIEMKFDSEYPEIY